MAASRAAPADLCIKELDGEEQALVRRVISRLIEEKRGANSGRTLWSITKTIFGMSQCDIDHLVDAYNYNTFGLHPPALARAADAGSPFADAAAGDPSDTQSIKELDSEERALVQRVISRLIQEKRDAKSAHTLWSITQKIFGMSQCDLDHLVDAYNTFGLCPPASACAADAGRPGADAAAGDPSDTHSAAEAPYQPVPDDAAEPEAPSELVPDDAVEPEAPSQPEPDDAVEPPPDSVAVYCEVCVIWLNGPKQYESHSIGRKHRKRERDRSRAKSPVPLAPADDAPSNGKVFQ